MPKTNHRPGVLFPLFLLLIAGSCIGLLTAAETYYKHTDAVIENTASIAPLNKTSLQTPAPVSSYHVDVKYRKFSLTAPGAKQVELVADFNRWGRTPLELTGGKKGYFEISVALPPGEYRYWFVVDGRDMPDPNNQECLTEDDRPVCIKTVK